MKNISLLNQEIEILKHGLSNYLISLESKLSQFDNYDCTYITNNTLLKEIRSEKESIQKEIFLLKEIGAKIEGADI